MIQIIRRHLQHAVNVVHGELRELHKRTTRDPRWHRVERMFLEQNQYCAACGGITRLQVHHKIAFAANPALELVPSNLMVLCMGRQECHLRIGHGNSFRFYNPEAERDAATCLRWPDMRVGFEMRAQRQRLPMRQAVQA